MATAKDLLTYFKDVTPNDLQYFINDLFETVTHYENKIITVSSMPLNNGKFKVDIEFEISKHRSDTRNSLPLSDFIDVGVYGEDGIELYLEKHKDYKC